MSSKSAIVALFAVFLMMVVPVSPAFAYSSEVTATENTISSQYSTLALYDENGAPVSSVITASVVPAGLMLRLSGTETCSYYVAVGVSGGSSELSGYNLGVKIGDQAARSVPMYSGKSVVFNGTSYEPSQQGVEIPVVITLPDLSKISSAKCSVIDAGEITFTMVRTSDVSNGSVVVSTTNTVVVNFKIKSSDDVEAVLEVANGTSAIKDDKQDVYYKIVAEKEAGKNVVYLSATASDKDKNITDRGKEISFSLVIPAGVKFYMKVTIGALVFGVNDKLHFVIDGVGKADVDGDFVSIGDTFVQSDGKSGITSGEKLSSKPWIDSGSGMVVKITGQRAQSLVDTLQLRVYMENA